jgi:uncharacterized repeat protein (TIGR02543 family)
LILGFRVARTTNNNQYASLDGVSDVTLTPAANDPNAPTSTNATLAADENVSTALAASNFGYADPNSSPLANVQITALPALGSLKLSGTAVTLNQIVTVADINSGNLTYLSPLGGFGTAYTTIGIKVQNSASPTGLWSLPATMTVNVTHVNHAPTSTGGSVVLNTNAIKTFASADFPFADVDAGDTFGAIKVVTSLPANGTLKLNGTAITAVPSAAIPVANIGTLTYTPNTDYTGADSFNFQVRDASLFSADATMAISVTSDIIVQNGSFENPNVGSWWTNTGAPWTDNCGGYGRVPASVNSVPSAPGGGVWIANMNDAPNPGNNWPGNIITQPLGSRTLNAGDTLQMTLYLYRTSSSGVLRVSFLDGTTTLASQDIDTSTQDANTWKLYTFSQTILTGVTANLQLKFQNVSGKVSWLDRVGNVSVTSGVTTYTVTFDNNTGSGTMTAQTGSSAANLTTNTFTKIGYTFTGWNTVAGGTGTAYADGANYTFTASTTLYAQWILDNTYLVAYNNNGGTGTQSDTNSYSSGATVTVLNAGTMSKTGYTFAGWDTQANGGGTHYNANDTFTMPANAVTLYAQWTINTYTVTFNNNDGSGTMPPQTGNYNTTAALTSNTFTRTGYTFAGWNTVNVGGGTAYANGANYTFTASTTLYAQWTADTYTVTFDGNGGGTPSPTSKSVTYDSTYGTLATVTRTGYTFNGWFTATSGGTQVTSGTTVALTAAQTLYAQWTAVPTITLADTLSAVNTTYGTASASPTSFHVSGSNLTGAPGNLTVTPPSGYEVSLSSGSGYSTSLSVPYSSDTLASTQVFVRLAATSGVASSPYSGNITVSGGGASSQTLATASSTVAKADATVVVTPYTVDYDGNEHTATVNSITGVNGETGATVGTVTLNTTHTNAGTYAADSWSFTPTANYNSIGTTTTPITVLNKSFETTALPNNASYWWALGSPWVGGISPQGYEVLQVNQFNTFTAAAAGIYAANLESWLVSVTQNLSTTVNAGDTLSMTFSGGRAKAGLPNGASNGGKFTATFKVGTTEYTSSEFDTGLQANDTWQTYTFTQTVGAGVSGNLSIIFKPVSGRPWLDNISNVSWTSGTPQTITDTINKAGSSVTTPTVGTYTYTGSPQGPNSGATATGSTGAVTYSYMGTGSTSYPASATQPTNAGTYTVTASVVTDTNYDTASSAATAFSIGKAALSVTASNQTKGEGQTVAFGSGSTLFTSIGLQNSETIASVTLACAGGAAGAAVGVYDITPSEATGGTFDANNYNITYTTTGELTVLALTTYAFGTTNTGPLELNENGTIKTRGQAPIIQTTVGSPLVKLTYARLKNSGCSYRAQFSNNLSVWLESTDPSMIYPPEVPTEVVVTDGDMEVVSVKFPIFRNNGGSYEKMEQNFSRIAVTAN